MPSLLLRVLIVPAFLSLSLLKARASRVTGGEMILDLDATALAALNFGYNPNVGALILEEFFSGAEDASRTRAQIISDHLIPGYVPIPATDLHLEINGAHPANLDRRFSQPTTMTFDPNDLTGTVAGSIGLRGTLRFIGDFDGIFVLGDFAFRFDPSRIDNSTGRTGWIFANYFDNFRAIAFETKHVTASLTAGRFSMTGTLLIAEQFAGAFLPGEAGKAVGTFSLKATIPGADFVPMEMVKVGQAGNAPDPATGFGSVDYDYWIGTTEVTNAQYARFLNFVDPEGVNPHELYNTNMGSDLPVSRGGINFLTTAPSGSKYQAKPLHANKPVSYVSFFDAARFANWMGTGDTERGFYTFTGLASLAEEGTHGPSFGTPYVALPSENEWYKAAYHKGDGPSSNYWLYPTQSNAAPLIATSLPNGDVANPGINVANYNFGADWNDSAGLGNVTTVGSAGPHSIGPYGTYDQGGNSWEWCSTSIGGLRVMRGGSLWSPLEFMQSLHRSDYFPETGGSSLSFRLSSSGPLLASAETGPLALADLRAMPDPTGVPALQFLSRSDMDYRFDYSKDGLEWFRLHEPISGSGSFLEVPIPRSFRDVGRCFVRAVVWKR